MRLHSRDPNGERIDEMRDWRRYIIQMLALANLLNFLVGVYWLQFAVSKFRFPTEIAEDAPYASQVFYAMWTINAICLLALLVAGICLWRSHPWGVKLCFTLFIFELLYWGVKKPIMFLLLKSDSQMALLVRGSISAASTLGNAGLAVQQEFLYPLFGLLLLIATVRRQSPPPDWGTQKTA